MGLTLSSGPGLTGLLVECGSGGNSVGQTEKKHRVNETAWLPRKRLEYRANCCDTACGGGGGHCGNTDIPTGDYPGQVRLAF
jgi:hypothetical protein